MIVKPEQAGTGNAGFSICILSSSNWCDFRLDGKNPFIDCYFFNSYLK
ncbi:hypothetical protein A33Q_1219 [Indibacter alkaliphilus LW1]|uniref:Uncharacterized protein n=1 Tax=Indibacter alkaliphilus (strain CCUG 57479 / KCTC 22604 / LW1) TaxID=1189612 RepID=S2DN03_INDAL|nr:hypothetical protein A33Q_1219 [Indibacter alkaliphilus LW1]